MSTSFIAVRRYSLSLIMGLFLCVAFLATAQVFAEEIELSSEPDVAAEERNVFSASEIKDISTPGIVQIVQHVEGSAVIPSFIIDSESNSVAVDINKDPIFVNNINENLIGSGFFISSDGYIATNAHTVSDTTIKLALMYSFIEQSLIDATGESDVSETIAKLFTPESVDYMLSQTTFELSKDIIVLFPETIPFEDPNSISVYDLGEIAQVVDSNDFYYKEADNVAIIKIDGNGYPVNARSDSRLLVGETYFASQVGFSSGIETVRDLSQVENRTTLFDEVVVVRDVSSTSTKLFSTNLVTDVNAVGGPILNEYGEVEGITTYDGSKGFSAEPVPLYIIPIEVIEEHSQLIGVITESLIFDEYFKKGIVSSRDMRCEEASAAFAVALGDKNMFTSRANDITYIDACGAALKALRDRQEGSGFLTAVKDIFSALNLMNIIMLIAGIILLILIVWMIVYILKKPRKKAQKKAIEPTPGERSEVVQQARRAPIKDMLPLEKENKDNSSKEEKAKPKEKAGTSSKPQNKNEDIVPPKKKTPSVEKEEVFYTVPAKFPMKHDVASEVAEQEIVHNKLSEAPKVDADKLAKMWPHKYGETQNEKPTVKETDKISEAPQKQEVKKQDFGVLQEAVAYIKHTRSLGFSDGEIERELLDAGWILRDIENAFEATK